jgi:hypothetical protein
MHRKTPLIALFVGATEVTSNGSGAASGNNRHRLTGGTPVSVISASSLPLGFGHVGEQYC